MVTKAAIKRNITFMHVRSTGAKSTERLGLAWLSTLILITTNVRTNSAYAHSYCNSQEKS